MTSVFHHDGFDLAYTDEGDGEPVFLIHGFASNAKVNWISTGWTSFLKDAGYRAVTLDNRGHGQSGKSYNEADYTPQKMASDVTALAAHLGIKIFHIIGYSMGARISAFTALASPLCVKTLTLGGLGIGLVKGVGDWDPIAAALQTEDPHSITHPQGAAFRKFADATKSDRKALAACIARSREELTPLQLSKLGQPVLIAVGTKDDIGGSPHELAALLPNGIAFGIEGRDHMLAVGDRTFKNRTLSFLRANPI
jgi:pimeloyl-ACP methyl ester carboxylesterase